MRKERASGIRPTTVAVMLIALVGLASVATAGALFVHSGGTMGDIAWLAGLMVDAVTNQTDEEPAPPAARGATDGGGAAAKPTPAREAPPPRATPATPPTPPTPPAPALPEQANETAHAATSRPPEPPVSKSNGAREVPPAVGARP